MATLTFDNDAVWDNTVAGTNKYTTSVTGTGGKSRPVSSIGGARPLTLISGKLTFDTSYPTGGEDISEIWNFFNKLGGIVCDIPNVTQKIVRIDYTNKKALVFIEGAAIFAEAGAATDQSAVVVRFMAWGL